MARIGPIQGPGPEGGRSVIACDDEEQASELMAIWNMFNDGCPEATDMAYSSGGFTMNDVNGEPLCHFGNDLMENIVQFARVRVNDLSESAAGRGAIDKEKVLVALKAAGTAGTTTRLIGEAYGVRGKIGQSGFLKVRTILRAMVKAGEVEADEKSSAGTLRTSIIWRLPTPGGETV